MFSLAYCQVLLALFALLTNVTQADVCGMADNDAAEDACAMKRAMLGSSVVPQILPDFSPKGALYVQYGNIVIGGAQQLSPARVYKAPALSLALVAGLTTKLHYVAMCLEFQPRTRVTRLTWLQDGLTADFISGHLTSSRPALVPYGSPNPSQGSGTRQYIILLYQQLQAIQLSDFKASAFNLNTFLSKTSLKGHLVAGSFFKSTYDGRSFPIQAANSRVKPRH